MLPGTTDFQPEAYLSRVMGPPRFRSSDLWVMGDRILLKCTDRTLAQRSLSPQMHRSHRSPICPGRSMHSRVFIIPTGMPLTHRQNAPEMHGYEAL